MDANTIKAGNKVHYYFIDEDGEHIIGEGVVIDVEHCDFGIGGIEDVITIKENNEIIVINNKVITHIIN